MANPFTTEVGIYAEEVDHRLQDITETARRAEHAKTDADLRDWKWFAKGVERAREVLREVLHDPVHREIRRKLVATGEAPFECRGSFRPAAVWETFGDEAFGICPECRERLWLKADTRAEAEHAPTARAFYFPRHLAKSGK